MPKPKTAANGKDLLQMLATLEIGVIAYQFVLANPRAMKRSRAMARRACSNIQSDIIQLLQDQYAVPKNSNDENRRGGGSLVDEFVQAVIRGDRRWKNRCVAQIFAVSS